MKQDINEKIFYDFESFKPVLEHWKSKGDTIVFTNGCFDIIHHGHVSSFSKASELGTRLVVGLNSDESVHALKGKGRPVLNIEARTTMLAALVFIDAVVVFNDATPTRLIEQIIPDILAKGSEYKLHEIVGHEVVLEHGGRVERLDFVDGISTSELISRIKALK